MKDLPLPNPQDLELAAEFDFGSTASCIPSAHLVVFGADIALPSCSCLSVPISYQSQQPLTVKNLVDILH